jgi:PKHD-type hydroxylase
MSQAEPTLRTLQWTRSPIFFTRDECAAVCETGRTLAGTAPVTVSGDPGVRLGKAHKLSEDDGTAWIYDRLRDAAMQANESRFALSLDRIHPHPEYVEYYAKNGRFDWHDDYSHGSQTAPRKLTVIAQLSPPEDYDGGELQVFDGGVVTLPKDQGAILIFPSFSVHRVTSVTRGERRALVSWFGGELLR